MTPESMRKRFADNLVGVWQTASGTFDGLCATTWRFLPDGSASEDDGRHVNTYLWRKHSTCAIELCDTTSDDGDDEDHGTQDASPADDWDLVRYDFKTIAHDGGREIVLHQVGQESFYMCMAPLRYVGEV